MNVESKRLSSSLRNMYLKCIWQKELRNTESL